LTQTLTEFYLILKFQTGLDPSVFAEFQKNPANFVTLVLHTGDGGEVWMDFFFGVSVCAFLAE
jgi:hypothetical protein